ncbi:DHH family phosphoesterase [Candidatus Saccharibacteria bacterium]|nr:DHH family phosphoesterase [Candidatus Saccharibacteria bacterium]
MHQEFQNFINGKNHLCIIQAENPDGDSLGATLALENILTHLDHETSLYCPVDIPKYIRYFTAWSRVTNDFSYKADGYIIVDTASATLLSKLLNDSAIKNRLEHAPILVIDHHETAPDLPFESTQITETSIATCKNLYNIFTAAKYDIDQDCAVNLLYGILSDTLGLTSQSVTAEDYRIAADLIDHGANIAEMEEHRRDFMKKSPRILDYKADLIKRVQYHLDGRLATVLIPFDDIQEYSDEYNPNVLILEELRLVEGVDIAVAIKTYPDGKLTGKIRASKPVAEQLAGFFGGGGHSYAAGFRTYDTYEHVLPELISAVTKLLEI